MYAARICRAIVPFITRLKIQMNSKSRKIVRLNGTHEWIGA